MGAKHVHPLCFEHAIQGRGGQDRLEEDSREDGCCEALQNLDDQRGELGDSVGGGRRDRTLSRVEHVDQKTGDGKEDGEDGDGGRDGEG